MSIIALAGFSNSGKSTSIRYLPPKETFIINVNNKQLAIPGFRKNYTKLHREPVVDENGNPVMRKMPDGKEMQKKAWVGNYYQSNDYQKLHTVLDVVNTLADVRYLVVDDINYLIGQDTMSLATTASRDKYSVFAYNYNKFIKHLMSMRDDLQVIIISHLQKDEDTGFTRMLSTSKSIDKYINIDGLFNYIIYAERIVDEIDNTVVYKFRTRTNGMDTCRSTSGCFKELYIEPNIKACIDRIDAFENGDEEPEYPDNVKHIEEKPKEDDDKKAEEKPKDDDDLEI